MRVDDKIETRNIAALRGTVLLLSFVVGLTRSLSSEMNLKGIERTPKVTTKQVKECGNHHLEL